MTKSWLRFPIYLDGEKRFDANPNGDVTVIDASKRMDFVFEHIEFCFAEGRLMDLEIFHQLEDLKDHVRRNNIPAYDEIRHLVDSIASRYGFDASIKSGSMWIRQDVCDQPAIWIDRELVIEESNRRLFE